MPNHVTNILSFKGNEENIKSLMELFQNDEVGTGSLDFNKVIPMPASLNIEEGSQTDTGVKLYNNFVSEYLLFSRQKTLTSLVPKEIEDAYIENHPEINKYVWHLGKAAFYNQLNYGHRTWYSWSIENWGTKWNAYGYGDEFEMMNRTMQQVEDKLEQRHLTQYKLQAEVMYAFNLVDFSESEHFVDNYVSCFRANQTDDSFVEAVNRKFSLDIDKEAFKKTISQLPTPPRRTLTSPMYL